MQPDDAAFGVTRVGLFVAACEEPETRKGFSFFVMFNHNTSLIGGMFVPKSDAKVEVKKTKPRQNLPRLQ